MQNNILLLYQQELDRKYNSFNKDLLSMDFPPGVGNMAMNKAGGNPYLQQHNVLARGHRELTKQVSTMYQT